MDDLSSSPEVRAVPSAGATEPRRPVDSGRGLAVYLFADIRGYTYFTAQRGAEASAELVDRFNRLAEESVGARRGRIRGTWGDEILAEFTSARDAVGAAVDLQIRCGDATLEDPSLPLGVGVGLDVGEPAGSEAATSADALNVAARLCDLAGPGECLATRELVHLAGSVDSVAYHDRGRLRLKGAGSRQVVDLRAAHVDRPRQARLAALMIGAAERRRAARRRRSVVAGIAAAALLVGSGTWYLAHRSDGPPTVPANGIGIIDAESGRLLGSVALGQAPDAVAVGGDSLWVTNTSDNSLSRVNLRTRAAVDRIRVGTAPVAAAAMDGFLWVVNSGDGTVTKIDLRSGDPVGEPVHVGNLPDAIASGFGALWVTDFGDDAVRRIDPGEVPPVVSDPIRVGDSPDGIAAGAGGVWVADRADNTVVRIDPKTLAVDSPIRVGAGPAGIVAAPSGVWVTDSLSLSVDRIDPATNQVATSGVQVGDSPTRVAADASAVWVSDTGDGTLTRIDPRTGRPSSRLFVGSSPHGIALVGSELWVTGQAFADASHRGGTLTIAAGGIDSLDPATSFVSGTVQVMGLLYDGLVAIHPAQGSAGYELVPDLAVALPTSQDGLTYTFTLRQGIHYSDGRLVRASDFRGALEREFQFGDKAEASGNYYQSIIGVPQCMAQPVGCNLSRGIVADDDKGTVTFKLSRPDPDLMGELSLPYAAATPPGLPAVDVGMNAFPGTGPYMTAAVQQPGSLTLVRNPYFHVWSTVAQPQGYPDSIRWQFMSTSDGTAAVIADKVDLLIRDNQFLGDAKAVQTLAERYPDRLHETPQVFLSYIAFNTARPPFDNRAVRQAVSYAVDRAAAAAANGSTLPACELVPLDFPGYTPHCPYTLNAGNGRQPWTGPDLARATRLLGASGVDLKRPLSVWTYHSPPYQAIGYYVVGLLKHLGFANARIKWNPPGQWYYDPDKIAAVEEFGAIWTADFPSAANFYGVVTCSPGSSSSACNPEIAKTAESAKATAASDPGESQRLWQRVYQLAQDDAITVATNTVPWVAFTSERVGNYLCNAFRGPLLDQMWVR